MIYLLNRYSEDCVLGHPNLLLLKVYLHFILVTVVNICIPGTCEQKY